MRKLLIILGILLVLLAGADIGGRLVAQAKAGDAIGNSAESGTAPTVRIHGFSFLAQALPGHYQKVSLASSNIDLGAVKGVTATIDLFDVRLPVSDALKGDVSNLTAGRADVQAVISTQSLESALGQKNLTITAGPSGGLRVATTVSVLGQTVPVTADVTATFANNSLHLAATSLLTSGVNIPGLDMLAPALSLDIPLGNLPVTVSSAGIEVDGNNLILHAQALDVKAGTFK